MSDLSRPHVPKWPYFAGDAFMLGLACFVYQQSRIPLEPFALGLICACVTVGALLAILPFVLEYRIVAKVAEAGALSTVMDQIRNLETIAGQISLATGQWQTVNEHAGKAVSAATDIGERMMTEAKSFAQSMQKASDTEKSTLRLEVDKLRRSEADWVQVTVRMLDHTFALHAAAVRSGKAGLIEQLTQFQSAVRDAARRVGLVPLVAQAGDRFDPSVHKSDQDTEPAAGTAIESTLATGYTLRGQLLRHTLVSVSHSSQEDATNPGSSDSSAQKVAEEQTLL